MENIIAKANLKALKAKLDIFMECAEKEVTNEDGTIDVDDRTAISMFREVINYAYDSEVARINDSVRIQKIDKNIAEITDKLDKLSSTLDQVESKLDKVAHASK